MPDHHRTYVVRCPVYGFIPFNDLERDIINQPAFQRLRRIRQLAWTDYVYPGAMHTRFEHSLGVMHMATMLYDGIIERSGGLLRNEFGYDDAGIQRYKTLVRLAALLHDIGHAPFSHAAEDLFPYREDGGERFRHEHYSAAIVRQCFSETIENHPVSTNHNISANEVANLLEGSPVASKVLFWRELIDSQMDADRMDYLLRDSIHTGVGYGRYDWQRIVGTIQAVRDENGRLSLGVAEGGWHAAEALILARYFMFTQVYFHKTRVAFDHHLHKALAEMLPKGEFPPPDENGIKDYLKWEDWRVLGEIANGEGGDHGRRLAERDHYREVWHTPETPESVDLDELERIKGALGEKLAAEEHADKSWYTVGTGDIPIVADSHKEAVKPLSEYSSIVDAMQPIKKISLYVKPEDVKSARTTLEMISSN